VYPYCTYVCDDLSGNLKRQCHEIFFPRFFANRLPLNTLKYFRFLSLICWEINEHVRHTLDHGPALCLIALDQYSEFYQKGPALCGISLDKSLQSNISANSKQKTKYFRVLNGGLGVIDWWKNQRSKFSRHCLFNAYFWVV
jgi:hypothetical protein